MRVLGLDLSTSATGWAVFDNGKLLDSGVIIPYENLEAGAKIFYVCNAVAGLIKVFNPDDLAVEDTFYGGKNFPMLRTLGRLCGAIFYIWYSFKRKDPVMYMASTARVSSGIKGTAQKEEVTESINKIYFSRRKPEHQLNPSKNETDHNIADAIVIGAHHSKVKQVEIICVKEPDEPKKAKRKRRRNV